MLINASTTVSAGDVITAKLINGEELIAKLTSVSGSSYTLSNPRVVALTPDGTGQARVSFAPFMIGAPDSAQITISLDKMLTTPIAARKEAADQYVRSTSSLDLSATL